MDFDSAKAEVKTRKLNRELKLSELKVSNIKAKMELLAEEHDKTASAADSYAQKIKEINQQLKDPSITTYKRDSLLEERAELVKNFEKEKEHANQLSAEYAKQEEALKKQENTTEEIADNIKLMQTKSKEATDDTKKSSKGTSKFSEGFAKAGKSAAQFAGRIKSLIASALIFSVITKAFTALREQFGKFMTVEGSATNKMLNQLKGNLSIIGATLYSAVQPILERLLSILLQITSVLAKGVTKMFGKSVKDMKALANATEEVKKGTESFDTINIASGGDSSDTSGAGDAYDFSGLETETGGFVSTILSTLAPLETVFSFLYENVLTPFSNWFKEDLAPETVESLSSAMTSLSTAASVLEGPLMRLWNNALKPIFDKFGEWVVDIVDQIGESFDYMSEKLVEYEDEIGMVIDGISTILQVIWAVISPIISSVVGGIGNVLKTTIDFIFSIIQAIGNFFAFFGNIFNAIKALFQGNTDEAVKYAKKALANLVNIFVGIGNAIISVINNLWSLIFDAFKGTVNAIGGLISKVGEWLGFDWDLEWKAKAPLIPLIPKYVPKLANGAVIPGGKAFAAILGDQPKGKTNLEAPEDLIRQIVREESGGKNFTVKATGSMAQLIRLLSLEITQEQNRVSVF